MCVSESRNKWLFGTKMLIAALKPTICQNSKKKETCWKRFDFSPRKELYKPPHQTHRIDRNQCRDIALGRFHIARKHPTKVERIYEQRQNGAEQRNRQHNLMLIFECQKELSSGRKGFEALFVGGWVVRFHGSVARATERKVHEKLFPLYSFFARYSFTLRYHGDFGQRFKLQLDWMSMNGTFMIFSLLEWLFLSLSFRKFYRHIVPLGWQPAVNNVAKCCLLSNDALSISD